MRYSEMTPLQRQQLFGDPGNYPLKVTFLNSTGLLNREAVDLLREQNVDFDVDDEQARRLLAGLEPAAGEERLRAQPPVGPVFGRPSPLLMSLAAAAGLVAVLGRFLGRRRP